MVANHMPNTHLHTAVDFTSAGQSGELPLHVSSGSHTPVDALQAKGTIVYLSVLANSCSQTGYALLIMQIFAM
jgi:hypothetical protein